MRLVPALVALLLCAPLVLPRPLDAREITGSLAYKMRIALPPSARIAVEISGAAGLVAARHDPARGAQVPLPFALTDPQGEALTLRAAIFLDGRPIWASDAVAIAAGMADVDLGLVPLDPFLALGDAARLDCGGERLALGLGEGVARLNAGAGAMTLAETPAAQGRRFSDGATPETALRIGTGDISVTLQGRALPDCLPVIVPNLLPFRASGTEPFWAVAITREGIAFQTPDAPAVTVPLPPADAGAGSLSFTESPLSVTLRDTLCRNAMSGMLFPVSVTLSTGGRTLEGCGGDPAALLDGVWHVAEIGGEALRGGAKVMFEFRNGRIAGRACNRFSGGFGLTGEGLAIGPVIATRMACPALQMQAETAAFAAFAATTGFDIDATDALVLTGPAGVLLTAAR